jgi:hypothetical protein
VAAVQYTLTHKQNTEHHNETQNLEERMRYGEEILTLLQFGSTLKFGVRKIPGSGFNLFSGHTKHHRKTHGSSK